LRQQEELEDAQRKLEKTELPVPGYFSARGLLKDPDWVDSYLSIVLQWPTTCSISVEERQLIGLAKSVAFMWEPGILNHTDLALETGSTPEQVTETIKTVASVVGLANLDRALRGQGSLKKLNAKKRSVLKNVSGYFGKIPECFKRRMIFEDPAWLIDLLKVTSPAYESNSEIMNPKLRALVALATAAVTGWDEGVSLYSKAAIRFGARNSETHDVIKSVFKTSVSNSMAGGFRTPCHIPSLEQYRTILSSFVESGALSKRNGDRLTVSSPAEPTH